MGKKKTKNKYKPTIPAKGACNHEELSSSDCNAPAACSDSFALHEWVDVSEQIQPLAVQSTPPIVNASADAERSGTAREQRTARSHPQAPSTPGQPEAAPFALAPPLQAQKEDFDFGSESDEDGWIVPPAPKTLNLFKLGESIAKSESVLTQASR